MRKAILSLSLCLTLFSAPMSAQTNTRVGKRGNLENISSDIFSILSGLPPDKPQQSLQVAMIEKMRNSTGEELAAFYRRIKNEPKDAYKLRRG